MPIFRLLHRAFLRFLYRVSLGLIILLLIGFYFVSWGIFVYGEGAESTFADPINWWYYFWTTVATIGYGDISPSKPLTRFYAGPFYVFGLMIFGSLLTKLGSAIHDFYSRKRRGLMPYVGKGHIVFLGYRSGLTERIISNIISDTRWDTPDIVLVSETLDEIPMIDGLTAFIKGVNSNPEVVAKANIKEASRVVCFGRNDPRTVAAVVAAKASGTRAHVVACLDDFSTSETIGAISPAVECVIGGIVDMVVDAVQDPGMTRLYARLMSNQGQAAMRINLPHHLSSKTFGEVFLAFKRTHDAMIIGVIMSHEHHSEFIENPPWDMEISGGMGLYYIGPSRITINNINWKEISGQLSGPGITCART